MLQYKVKNKFNVSKFITLVDIDFIYSKTKSNPEYLLLNQAAFGSFAVSTVEEQKTMRIVIIHNDTMMMESYNIPEEEMINALMNMGSWNERNY